MLTFHHLVSTLQIVWHAYTFLYVHQYGPFSYEFEAVPNIMASVSLLFLPPSMIQYYSFLFSLSVSYDNNIKLVSLVEFLKISNFGFFIY